MADEASQKEPSMEEILASIRRIISEDGEEEEKPEAGQAAAQEETPQAFDGAPDELLPIEASPAEVPPGEAVDPADAGDDVLELTEEVDDNGNAVEAQAVEPVAEAFEPAPVPVPAPEPVLEPEPIAAAQVQTEAPPPAPPELDQSLIENITEDTAAGAFAALASQMGMSEVDREGQKIAPGGRTIEDHVLEMLRPMLREWLDKHLPQVVQRLVQREIDRIIHRSDPV